MKSSPGSPLDSYAVEGSSRGLPPSTTSIAATPSLMPLLKLPVLNDGVMTWLMITELWASVRRSSRPYPTSIRSRRSSRAMISKAPLFLSFCPMPQWRPSW
ncbi:hypothetical protein D3C72_1569810 [compost metagenome]